MSVTSETQLPLPPLPKREQFGRVFRSSMATFVGVNGAKTEQLWLEKRERGEEIFRLPTIPLPQRLVNKAFPDRNGDIILIMAPKIMREFWTKGADAIDQETAKQFMSFIMGSDSILLQAGAKHRRLRQAMNPVLTRSAVETYRAEMVSIVDRFIDDLPIGGTVRLQDLMAEINLEIILRTGFGITDPEELEEWSRVVRGSMGMTLSREGFVRLAIAMLTGAELSKVWPKGSQLLQQMDAMIYRLFGTRRGTLDLRDEDGRESHTDLTSRLLRVSDEDGNPLSDKEIRDQTVSMALAGHETTATATAWAVERLIRHPEALARLREEALAGESEEYVNAVTMETLRLRSSIGGIGAQTTKDIVAGGYRIPAGSTIAMPLAALHRDPELYPDPAAFKPERFLDTKPDLFGWMPFGAGRHRCIGMHLATLEINLALHRLIGRLDMEPVDPADENLKIRVFLSAPEHGARVRIVGRRAADEVPIFGAGCPVHS